MEETKVMTFTQPKQLNCVSATHFTEGAALELKGYFGALCRVKITSVLPYTLFSPPQEYAITAKPHCYEYTVSIVL
jgi:hypothetical protein